MAEATRKDQIGLKHIDVFDSYSLYYDEDSSELCVRSDDELRKVSADELAKCLFNSPGLIEAMNALKHKSSSDLSKTLNTLRQAGTVSASEASDNITRDMRKIDDAKAWDEYFESCEGHKKGDYR